MKQTQTHVWSLAGEEAVSYSLARGKAAAVTRESGEVAAYSLARAVSCTWAPGRAAPRWDRGKTPKPLLSCLSRPRLDTMRGAKKKSYRKLPNRGTNSRPMYENRTRYPPRHARTCNVLSLYGPYKPNRSVSLRYYHATLPRATC